MASCDCRLMSDRTRISNSTCNHCTSITAILDRKYPKLHSAYADTYAHRSAPALVRASCTLRSSVGVDKYSWERFGVGLFAIAEISIYMHLCMHNYYLYHHYLLSDHRTVGVCGFCKQKFVFLVLVYGFMLQSWSSKSYAIIVNLNLRHTLHSMIF